MESTVVEPVGVDSASGFGKDPGKSGLGVVFVQDVNLTLDLKITAEIA